MNIKEDFFELGRGAELIPNEYWHQYVLGIDLSSSEKQFVAIEVGKTEQIYRKELSLKDLTRNEWVQLIEKSKTKDIIDSLKQSAASDGNIPNEFFELISKRIATKDSIDGVTSPKNWTV